MKLPINPFILIAKNQQRLRLLAFFSFLFLPFLLCNYHFWANNYRNWSRQYLKINFFKLADSSSRANHKKNAREIFILQRGVFFLEYLKVNLLRSFKKQWTIAVGSFMDAKKKQKNFFIRNGLLGNFFFFVLGSIRILRKFRGGLCKTIFKRILISSYINNAIVSTIYFLIFYILLHILYTSSYFFF